MSLNGNSLKVDPSTGFLEPTKNYFLQGFTPELKDRIIRHLAADYNVSSACKTIGIDRNTFYNAVRMDKEFERQVVNAREQHLDDLESTMFRNGKTEKGTADRIFALKSWRKERYGDKTVVEHSKKKPVDELFSALEASGQMVTIESANLEAEPRDNSILPHNPPVE